MGARWMRLLFARTVVNFVWLPLVGAFHGWLTNSVAVWLLFRPIQPWRIPLTPWAVQGVLPRRHADLAASVGRAVEEQLLAWEDLSGALHSPQVLDHLAHMVRQAVAARVEAWLPQVLPPQLRLRLAAMAAEAVGREVPHLAAEVLGSTVRVAQEQLPIARLVEEKVASLRPEELEQLARRAARAELRSIVRLGFIMGLVIGVAQGALLEALGQ